jgi:hypothetical protein
MIRHRELAFIASLLMKAVVNKICLAEEKEKHEEH